MSINEGILLSLTCGQAFRFDCVNGVYTGVIGNKVYSLDKTNLNLIETDAILREYFDIDTDYEKIKEYLSSLSPVMKKAIEHAPYIRILKQEPIETLMSFILTSCNNIPRIKGMIERLSIKYGEYITSINGKDYYSFPSVHSLAGAREDELKALGLGFRAPYIKNAAMMIDSGKFDINAIYKMDESASREYLTTLKGVGGKIADCVLLFGYNRLNVFPKDVHIKRVMANDFPQKDETFFAPYSGIAQQFLFYKDL